MTILGKNIQLKMHDYVFQAGDSWVSQAQIVYAIAALSFVITGFINLSAAPGILGVLFILAGKAKTSGRSFQKMSD